MRRRPTPRPLKRTLREPYADYRKNLLEPRPHWRAFIMNQQQLSEQLPSIIDELVGSLGGEPGLQHLNRVYLPSKETIVDAIKRLRQIIFPGYFGEQGLTASNVS